VSSKLRECSSKKIDFCCTEAWFPISSCTMSVRLSSFKVAGSSVLSCLAWCNVGEGHVLMFVLVGMIGGGMVGVNSYRVGDHLGYLGLCCKGLRKLYLHLAWG
jgi:hypothetical protein